jgi:hypothetical protein
MRLIEEPKHGDHVDLPSFYGSVLDVFEQDAVVEYPHSTSYGYVIRGRVAVDPHPDSEVGIRSGHVRAGGYFAIPGGKFSLKIGAPGETTIAIVTRLGFEGMVHLGEIEKEGRLSYIDGCSDTVLISPLRQGDPCLNYLYFPPGVVQTQHTHPTIRVGVLARGRGEAWKGTPGTPGAWRKMMPTGSIFILERQELHSFRTDETQDSMEIIAYHPDSDWGPTDVNHPMLNRTAIGNAR